LIFAKVVGN